MNEQEREGFVAAVYMKLLLTHYEPEIGESLHVHRWPDGRIGLAEDGEPGECLVDILGVEDICGEDWAAGLDVKWDMRGVSLRFLDEASYWVSRYGAERIERAKRHEVDPFYNYYEDEEDWEAWAEQEDDIEVVDDSADADDEEAETIEEWLEDEEAS